MDTVNRVHVNGVAMHIGHSSQLDTCEQRACQRGIQGRVHVDTVNRVHVNGVVMPNEEHVSSKYVSCQNRNRLTQIWGSSHPDMGEIRVILSSHEYNEKTLDAVLKIEVADTGIGMKHESIQKLFDPFTQMHVHRDTGGTGLGLSITKKIVTLMKGSITCNFSENSGYTRPS